MKNSDGKALAFKLTFAEDPALYKPLKLLVQLSIGANEFHLSPLFYWS